MSKFMCDFCGVKVEKTLIFYTHTHTHTHVIIGKQKKIADGDFNRIGREGDSDGIF
jgi:hypothetical protein